MKRTFRWATSATLFTIALSCATADLARAQEAAPPQPTPEPSRNETWSGVSDAAAVGALGLALLVPRFYYPSNEVTYGWKSRWHLSVLAPVMTYATLTLVNEHFLKDSIKGQRPGCDDTNFGRTNCTDYGAPSSHAFVAGSTLGHGVAVFLVDTAKSDGQINPWSVVGNVVAPLALGALNVAGRAAGNYEDGGQILAGALPGLGVGFLLGLTYATLQRPDCGYSGSLICW